METLQNLVFFKDKHISNVIPIATGYSQDTFAVYCDKNDVYFAKYFDSENTHFAAIEKEVLHLTTDNPSTLKLLYHDVHWLVTPYLKGGNLANKVMAIDKKVTLTIEAMLSFQTTLIDSKLISPLNFSSILSFFTHRINLSASQKVLLKSILIDELLIDNASYVLCHGDLNFTNVLITETQRVNPTLIDFECCCYAEIEYDLGMMIAINNLVKSTDLQVTLTNIEAYLTTKLISINKQRVTRYLLKSLLINGLWYLDKYNVTMDKQWLYLAFEQFNQADVVNGEGNIISTMFEGVF
ncbi:phosphotransferase [Thalassotalea piscium]|uniref:Aminoglycoside phosphotransferase n=1 Tax=Thalassotalea piscium TaxID=1230533 RepID=A0A7X0NF35_9GAMM|nr:phosphotransferase [Thalassotalea piscium]MBB6542298.1 aminoglycoside phosphotransferase [Thalassotalea piscium]